MTESFTPCDFAHNTFKTRLRNLENYYSKLLLNSAFGSMASITKPPPEMEKVIEDSKLPFHDFVDKISSIYKTLGETYAYILDASNSPKTTKSSKSQKQIRREKRRSARAFLKETVTGWTSRVAALLQAIVDVCYVHQGRYPSAKSIDNFFVRYLVLAICDEMEERFKYHSGVLVCSLLPGTDLPKGEPYEGEIPGVVIGGWVRRFFTGLSSHKRKIQFALALQNAKRGALAISPAKQVKAMFEHMDSMRGLGYDAKLHEERDLDGVKSAISDVVRKYYRKGNFTSEIPYWRSPSTGATIHYSRKQGGFLCQAGHYCKEFSQPIVNHRLSEPFAVQAGILINRDSPSERIDVYSPNGCQISFLREALSYHALRHERNSAAYAQVLEAFKVRGLTKGEGAWHQLGRLMQKPLHRRIRSPTGPFRFIGKVINVNDINDVYVGSWLSTIDRWVSRGRRKNEFTWFVSGDYSKATDNMHPDLPLKFIEVLLEIQDFSLIWEKVLRALLGSHILDYSKEIERFLAQYDEVLEMSPEVKAKLEELNVQFNTHGFRLEQIHGQLMGSPLSFPVLCIVNAAMLLASVRSYTGNHLYSYKDLLSKWRPQFNGDDISFLSNPDHYKVWSRICSAGGLSLSPGKNYVSADFVNLNSTTFWAEKKEIKEGLYEILSFERLFVCNPGLIRGQGKVLEDTRKDLDKTKSLMPFCDQLQECKNASNEIEASRIDEVFRWHLTPLLKESIRPWSLPRFLGGLGLPFGDHTIKPKHLWAAKQIIERNCLAADCALENDVVIHSKRAMRDLLDLIERNENSYNLKNLRKDIVVPPMISDQILVQPELFPMPSLDNMYLISASREYKVEGRSVTGGTSRMRYQNVEHHYATLLKEFKRVDVELVDLPSIEYLKSLYFYKGGLTEPWELIYPGEEHPYDF